jgi:hypothetical protein
VTFTRCRSSDIFADVNPTRFERPSAKGERVHDPDRKSFCVLPWIHMNLNPDGRVVNFMQFVNVLDTTRRLSFRLIAPDVHDAVAADAGGWDARTRYAE